MILKNLIKYYFLSFNCCILISGELCVSRGGNSPPGEMRGGVVPLYGAGHAGHVHHRSHQVQAQGKHPVYNVLAVGTHLLMCVGFLIFHMF